MNQSLPVSYKVKIDESKPPATAEEYMLRVRLEAERMPVVLRADIPEPESKPEESFDQTLNHVALAECPADYLPTTQWSSSVLKDFVDLRQYMDFWAAHGVGSKDSGRRMPVPAMKDFMGWVIFFFGADGISIVESLFNGDEDNEEKEHQVAQPDKQTGKKRQNRKKRAAKKQPVKQEINDGTKVEANFMRMGHRPGKIVKTHSDGLYDILYDHGAKEVHVPASQVSAFSEQLCKESKGVKSADPVHQDESIASPEETEAASLDQQDYLDKPRESIVENRRDKQWAEVHPEGVAPSLSLILQFDQVLTQKLLGYWVDLLEVLPMNRQASGWIYALLSKIQWPLHRDTAAMLRAILRLCCKQRAQVQEIEDQILPMLNVIILITGNYYKQSDLESN